MNYIIVITVLAFLGWVWYQIQKRIGEQQAMEWQEYKKTLPQEPVRSKDAERMTPEQQAFVKDMWARHEKSHQTKSVE